MAIKKVKYHPAGTGHADINHFETDDTMVLMTVGGTLAAKIATSAADYVRKPAYGPATGAVNAYTFSAMAAAALVDGMSIYLDNVIAANTGAATFNWSGLGAKAIVDAKGAALVAGKMPLNCIIGLRYNASTASFQLLGEGGEYGTAVAGDVVAGHTIGTAAGLVGGTVVEKVGSATVITPSAADQTIPAGRYGGAAGDGKVLAVANASAGNIKSGIVIAGVTGTLPDGTGLHAASGGTASAISSASSMSINTGLGSSLTHFTIGSTNRPTTLMFDLATMSAAGCSYAGNSGGIVTISFASGDTFDARWTAYA